MENIGRRGFLKGLAGLTGGALVGQYVVDAPSVVEAKDFALPLRDIIVPKSPRIVVAQSISSELAHIDAKVDSWSMHLHRDLEEFVGDSGWVQRRLREPDAVYGEIELHAQLLGAPSTWQKAFQATPGQTIRVYFEVVNE